jgi:hypothetical protein
MSLLPVARIQHPLAVLAVAVGLGMAIGLGMAAGIGSPRSGPVYTVGQLRALLTQDPGVWADATVRVRGIAEPCLTSGSPARLFYCRQRQQDVLYPAPGDASDGLPLAWGTRPAWFAFLRRVPVLGALLPTAQALRWGTDATYRVQLRTPADAGSCDSLPCVEAVLLDAAG